MTTPNIFANGEDANSFFRAPSGQGDGPRLVVRTASVPSGTAVGQVIGLIPFNKGARLGYPGTLITDNLGASVTLNYGYVYNDNITYTNDTDAFISLGVGSAAGVLTFDEVAGATFQAEADGWFAVTIAGATTGTTGNITANSVISYQG